MTSLITHRTLVDPSTESAPPGSRCRRAVLAACTLLLAIAAGCGASSTDQAQEEAASTSASASSVPEVEAESPIGDLLGIPITDDDAMDEYLSRLRGEAEQKVAECMRNVGFTYTPVDASGLEEALADGSGTREYAEVKGFGLAPFPDEEVREIIEGFRDPNQDYVMTLTEAEREDFQIALAGRAPEGDDNSESFSEPRGCQGKAYAATFAFGEVIDKFGDELQAMTESFEADARIVEARRNWTRCMSDRGFAFASPDDARVQFTERYQAFLNNDAIYEPVGTTVDGQPSFPTLKTEYRASLDAIIEEETEAAVATWDCYQPMIPIERTVEIELERAFVNAYGDDLRAALGES